MAVAWAVPLGSVMTAALVMGRERTRTRAPATGVVPSVPRTRKATATRVSA